MKDTFKNIKKVYSYGKKIKLSLFFEAFGSLIGIIIGIVVPILAAKQIVYLTDNSWIQLFYMSVIVFILNMLANSKTVLIRKNTQKVTVDITESIQKAVGRELLNTEQECIDNSSSGTFIQRLTSDTMEMANMFTVGMGRVTGIVSSIGTFISVFIINKIVFCYYLLASIILTLLHLSKASEVAIKEKEKRKESDKITSFVGELVRGSRDIKMLYSKDSFLLRLEELTKKGNQKYIEVRNVDIFYNFIIESLSSLFELGIIMLLAYLIMVDRETVAMALALYSYRTRVLQSFMTSISSLLDECNRFNISCKRVFDVIESNGFAKEKFGSKHLKNIKGDFEFRDVVFGYDEDKTVLNGLSFKVDANTTVGFVGKSGAGKTTVFNVISKLNTIKSGSISIDGVNIDDLDEDSIRGNITIIGQNPYIFNMSIKDNFKVIRNNVTNKEIQEACKLACLDEFIDSLPDKYDTIIGEGGVNLSGGQKQRLAIARAFIQKTEIILFDEATSALDNETQLKIQKAIENLKGEYTLLIIAHRLSTIINCDKIFVIDNGKVVDSGTHKQLLKTNKMYKKLCETELVEK